MAIKATLYYISWISYKFYKKTNDKKIQKSYILIGIINFLILDVTVQTYPHDFFYNHDYDYDLVYILIIWNRTCHLIIYISWAKLNEN